MIVHSTEWSYDFYTSVSDSSDPRQFSDRSELMGLGYHGYQLTPDDPREPDDDRFDPDAQKTNLQSKLNERRSVERETNNLSPVKMMKQTENGKRRKGSGFRSRSPRVTFDKQAAMSRSLPNYHPEVGFTDPIPISSDDVYELLCRSQRQEEKLAELRLKLFPEEQLDNLGQGHIGSHGKRLPPVGRYSPDKKTLRHRSKLCVWVFGISLLLGTKLPVFV